MIAQEILTPLVELYPNTLTGSKGSSLNLERFWAIATLSQIKNNFDIVYILGSWYGNVALLLFMLNKYITFDQIINVDTNATALKVGQQRLAKLGLNNKTEPMLKDANELDYQQLGPSGLVINLSCHNIKGLSWLNNVPTGAMVVLQARNGDPGAVNQYENFKEDVVPPFTVFAYEDMDIYPWRHAQNSSMVDSGKPNAWGEGPDKHYRLKGRRDIAKHLISGLIQSDIDVSYAYKPLHHSSLAHAFTNAILYLDYDRVGWEYPTIAMPINCYGSKVISAKGFLTKNGRAT